MEPDQHGIDLVVDISGPDGKLVRTIDSPNGSEGPEPIDLTAFQTGQYKLVIHALEKTASPGKYVIQIDRILPVEDNGQRIAEKIYPPALLNLWRAYQTDPKAVEIFVESRKGKGPFIEDVEGNRKAVRVTYIYYGDENTESVRMNDGPHAGEGGLRLKRFMTTPLFFGSELVPRDSRYQYLFTATQTRFAGPTGAIQVSEEIVTSGSSVLAMPDAPAQPYLIKSDSVRQGKLIPANIKSIALHEDRPVTIYTPPGYDVAKACELLIVFDGEDHDGRPSSEIPTPTILDNLIAARKINLTVAVFVNNVGHRQKDLTGSPAFAEFIAKELVPWVRKNYRISPGASHVVVTGESLGGLAASHCAIMHSEVIGKVLSQSGSYWVTKDWQTPAPWPLTEDTGDLVGVFRKTRRLPIRFYITIGRFESAGRMVGTNREFRDVLLLKGYPVTYKEVDGGHDSIWWRGSLADGLISLIGRKAY
jgi:enterochelin esterase family protein